MEDKPWMEIEATGVYEGTLLEDMIDTVSKYHKLYCDVDIPGFFNKNHRHPLTFVPLWAMSLPLHKGDKVLVKFGDNDYARPYLWRKKEEIDHWHWDEWKFPEGIEHFTTHPESDKNCSVVRFGEESFVIKTHEYTLVRQNDGFAFINTKGEIYVQGNKVQAEVKGDMLADVKGNARLYVKENTEVLVEGNKDEHIVGNETEHVEGTSDKHIEDDTTVNCDSDVSIHIIGKTTLKIDDDTDVHVIGNTNFKCDGNVTIDSPNVTVQGGNLIKNGSVAATGSGGFCAIPVCRLTGEPHVGTIISE